MGATEKKYKLSSKLTAICEDFFSTKCRACGREVPNEIGGRWDRGFHKYCTKFCRDLMED